MSNKSDDGEGCRLLASYLYSFWRNNQIHLFHELNFSRERIRGIANTGDAGPAPTFTAGQKKNVLLPLPWSGKLRLGSAVREMGRLKKSRQGGEGTL